MYLYCSQCAPRVTHPTLHGAHIKPFRVPVQPSRVFHSLRVSPQPSTITTAFACSRSLRCTAANSGIGAKRCVVRFRRGYSSHRFLLLHRNSLPPTRDTKRYSTPHAIPIHSRTYPRAKGIVFSPLQRQLTTIAVTKSKKTARHLHQERGELSHGGVSAPTERGPRYFVLFLSLSPSLPFRGSRSWGVVRARLMNKRAGTRH